LKLSITRWIGRSRSAPKSAAASAALDPVQPLVLAWPAEERDVSTNTSNRSFIYYSWAVLVYVVGVIVWGAFVRATGSGAGCGEHWPLCNGQVIPRAPELATLIEFSHRITSGLSLVLVGRLVFLAFKRFPRGGAVRQGAVASAVLLVVEAVIGAGLVLLRLVGDDDSVLRAVVIAVHLINTFLLLGTLTYTAWSATTGQVERLRLVAGPSTRTLAVSVLLFLAVGASGAIVALGDTLFPSASFAEGLRQDFSPAAHFLIRLRVIHPALAILTSLHLLFVAARHNSFAWLGTAVLAQVAVGASNMFLAAPISLQLLHLFLADVCWVALMLTVFRTLREAGPVDTAAPVSRLIARHEVVGRG
jgi:cytochrome c oxidase assembly protein subunit 15/protoheme IX farnesyltransferase